MCFQARRKGAPTTSKSSSIKTRAARELSTSRWRKNAMSWRKRIIKDMSCASSRDSTGGCKEDGRRRGELIRVGVTEFALIHVPPLFDWNQKTTHHSEFRSFPADAGIVRP